MNDSLQKFMFEHAGVRGELVELSTSWRQILARQAYPQVVQRLLGELVAASTLLSANLKFDGTLILQIHGDGPVKLLVVECDAELKIRATAKLSGDIADNASLRELIHANGNGRFVITLDPNNKVPGQQAYQGIVPIDGENIASIIENYMLRSEQLDSRIWLAADDQVARGMLLQKLPDHGGHVEAQEDPSEAWNRALMLGNTLKEDELLSTDIQTLMRRLFWEETLRVFDPQQPQFFCNCTREKVGNMLKMLGETEVNTAVNELGQLDIHCDFCGKHYGFDKVDCAQIFASGVSAPVPETAHKH